MRRSLSASSFTRLGGFGRGSIPTTTAVLGTTTASATIRDSAAEDGDDAQIIARAVTWEFCYTAGEYVF